MVAETGPSAPLFSEERRTPLKRIQYFLHLYPTTIPFVVLLGGIVVFALIVGDRFFHPFNLSLVLQQVTVIALLAVGQTMIILVAGIDLSVGAIMVLSSVVMGRLAVITGLPPEIALCLGLMTGAACGFLNGILVTLLRLPPFIVTLGTWSIFESINYLYSKNQTLRQQDVEAVAPILQFTGWSVRLHDIIPLDFLRGATLTMGSALMIFVAMVVAYILGRTAFGRHVYTTGDDAETARLVGINLKWTLIRVYTAAGFICGIAGWVLIGRIGAISPNAGYNANLDSITAVVIGGTSLFGGRGAIIGTLFGALIVGVFRNGLALAGLQNNWQELAVGALIIVAVALDQWIRRVSV
jgi:fructose transport system permease protein